MFADSGNLISREDYAKGYALYAIDLTPDLTSSDELVTAFVRKMFPV